MWPWTTVQQQLDQIQAQLTMLTSRQDQIIQALMQAGLKVEPPKPPLPPNYRKRTDADVTVATRERRAEIEAERLRKQARMAPPILASPASPSGESPTSAKTVSTTIPSPPSSASPGASTTEVRTTRTSSAATPDIR